MFFFFFKDSYIAIIGDIKKSKKKIKMLCWITKLLAIHRPANITISHLISVYKPKKIKKIFFSMKLVIKGCVLIWKKI